jgi:hypothetical protein
MKNNASPNKITIDSKSEYLVNESLLIGTRLPLIVLEKISIV